MALKFMERFELFRGENRVVSRLFVLVTASVPKLFYS